MTTERSTLDVPDYSQLLCGYYAAGHPYYTRRPAGTGDWFISVTLSGTGRFGSPPTDFLATSGKIVMIPPGVAHEYGTAARAGQWEILWIHFHPRPHWHEWLSWPQVSARVMHMDLSGVDWRKVLVAVWDVYTHSTSTMPYGADLAMNALEETILLCRVSLAQSTIDARIRTSMNYIDSHLHERMPIEVLAGRVALSSSRFSHLFGQQAGVTPNQYIDLRRIERAKQMLERRTDSIGHIAEQLGFDPISFAQRFKQHTGMSPREYRKTITANRGKSIAAEVH